MAELADLGQRQGGGEGANSGRLRLIHLRYSRNLHRTALTDVYAELCARALDRGWSFEIIAPEATRDSEWTTFLAQRGARIHHLPEGGKRKTAAGIRSVLGSGGAPVLLHTHFTGYDIPAAVAGRSHGDTVTLWHVHSFLPSSRRAVLRLRLKWTLFRHAVARLVVPSDNIRDGLRRAGVPAERIVMFSSGIEIGRYPLPSPEQRRQRRAEIGVPDSAKLLLNFGWDYQVKGTDRFLEAVRLLVDSGVEVVAYVHNGGDQARAAAERLGLGEVLRIGAFVEETWSLYAAADCMVAPSRGEGMPFSVVEAVATGIPVVASELPGHRYIGDNAPGCRVIDPEPETIAAAVRAVLDRSTEQADREAAEGRAWIVDKLSTGKVVEGLLEEYGRALAERGIAV